MTEPKLQAVAGPVGDFDRAVPLLEGFEMLGAGCRTTGYKRLKVEPGFPRPFRVGRQLFFLQSELMAHLARLAAQRGMPEANL